MNTSKIYETGINHLGHSYTDIMLILGLDRDFDKETIGLCIIGSIV